MNFLILILFSGCDSGFGRGIAERLASKGHQVFAGCLTQEGSFWLPFWLLAKFEYFFSLSGVNSLSQSLPSVASFILDVTKPADVQRAVGIVAQHSPQGLNGLVNNAYVGTLRFVCLNESTNLLIIVLLFPVASCWARFSNGLT